jgi:cytochrome c5
MFLGGGTVTLAPALMILPTQRSSEDGMRRLLPALVLAALGACSRGEPAPQASEQGPNPQLTQQERRLLASATIALPPEGLTAESLPEPASRGAQLMVAYCTQCHALPTPAMHAAQDWPGVMRRMWVRIDMMHGELGVAAPSAGDRVALLTYTLAHALRVAENLPAGRGRESFEATCSRCHTVPDPRSHSPADWPAVVMRMERNMERMRVSGISNETTQTIVTYLETASRR